MSRYDHPEAGEWIQPRREGYLLACCDCGLVHTLDFRIVKNRRGNFIQFRVFRATRSTGQLRRWMKKFKEGLFGS